MHKRIEEFSLARMIKSSIFMVLVIDKLQEYRELKFLDLSGIPLSNEGAKSLRTLLQHTQTLELLNLSGSLQSYEPARQLFNGLYLNVTLKYLNLSCNKFNQNEKEFGSRIGRLVQVHEHLVHLDISFSKLSKEEILFICFCLRDNISLMSVHMGLNQVDTKYRLIARAILNAQVKHPFRS